MASVTWVEMTAPSLLLGGLDLVVGRDIRQVNRYSLKACWSTVLTVTNYFLYSQKLCRYILSGSTWIGPGGNVTCTLL